MRVVDNPAGMFGISKKYKLKGKTIGFVPTMGALHNGHLSLIRKARKENDTVVVSIFVNPSQFGPKEDFKGYPRTIKKDFSFCRREGVDILFYPQTNSMYPAGFRTYVGVEGLSGVLCGKSRPGHFKGVATVLTKLFNIVQPDIAYFGRKDAQQAIIIKRLTADLNIPLRIKIMPTVRERDGLALSSRNIYLSGKERKDALVLYQSLNLAKRLINSGIKAPHKIIAGMRQIINKKCTAKIDYISIVGPDNLKPLNKITGKCLIALAVWIGKTRLIDNLICPDH